MSIYHNGKEYGATKVINYSASPDYNRGVTVDNIQTGNYQASDNGFLMIQLQSQQSNPTKISVVRSKTPITDTGTEIASIVLSQYQYSETLTAQVMARDYYKLVIEGVGNPQVISCMFYPYASNVPIKLTENISVEQVEGLENELATKQDAGDYATNTALNNGLAGKQDKGNYFNKDTDVLDIAHGGHGGTTKEQAQKKLGINDFKINRYERLDLNKAKNGVLVARTNYLENRPSSLINSSEVIVETVLGQNSTTFSDNDEYTYNLQTYRARSGFEYAQRICAPNGAVGEWKLLRNNDGSIPIAMGGTGTTVGALPFSSTLKESIVVSDDFTIDLNVGDLISILLKGSTKEKITQTYTQNGTYLLHWFRRRKDTKELYDNCSEIIVITPSNKIGEWNGSYEGMCNIIRIK